jgi:hypothetical protein
MLGVNENVGDENVGDDDDARCDRRRFKGGGLGLGL